MNGQTPPKDGLTPANQAAVLGYERAHPMQPGETAQQALARHSQGGANQTNSKANSARTAAAQARIRNVSGAKTAPPGTGRTAGAATRKGRTL
jgi:hypothetical protein